MGDQNASGWDRVIVVVGAQEGLMSVVAVVEDSGSSGQVAAGRQYEGQDIETRVCCPLMILDIREQLRNVEDVMI